MSDLKHLDLTVSQVQSNDHPPLRLTSRKNSVSMSLTAFDVLDPNLSTPFQCIKVPQELTIFQSNISINVRDIYPLLNTIRVRLHILGV